MAGADVRGARTRAARVAFAALGVFGAGAAACRLGGEPTPQPLHGDMPATIAVWPVVAEAHAGERELLLDGLDEALRARGHRAIPFAIAVQLLGADVPPSPEDAMQQARALLAADAAMQLVVRDFVADGQRPLRDARWDLEWRLVSLRGQGVLWSWQTRGSWQPRTADIGDPHRALDAEREIVPIGGDRRVTLHDAGELLTSLHRLAMSHLPAATR